MKAPRSLRSASVLAFSLALLAAACGRPAPETRFLNFDAESSTGALTTGWSGFEKTGEGDTFVWAQARVATVTVSAGSAADRLVRFRAWPFGWDGAPPQTVTISVNDVRLETITLPGGQRVYTVSSPGPAWKRGLNVLKLEFAWAESPKDRVPGATDARTLAAGFDWIEILPVSSGGLRRP